MPGFQPARGAEKHDPMPLVRCMNHDYIRLMARIEGTRKKDFLVVYDYGMGGVWAVIQARSAEEITAKYPVLEVMERRPAWMSRLEYDRLRRKERYDIDRPSGWFLLSLPRD